MHDARANTEARGSGGVARVFRLLDEIVSHGPLRFAELEDRLNLPKASLHRALHDLQLERLIQFDERSQIYSAGFRVLELANLVWARSDIRTLARDQLVQLCVTSNETVQLAMLADTHAVYIDSVESSNNVRMSMNIGSKAPVYCSGTGKVLLAWCSIEEQKAIMERTSFAEFTPNTITRPALLLAELKKIRKLGYAEDNEEHFTGIRCIAAPIVNQADQCVGAISIAAPTFRIQADVFDQWRQCLVDSAAIVSERLPPVTQL